MMGTCRICVDNLRGWNTLKPALPGQLQNCLSQVPVAQAVRSGSGASSASSPSLSDGPSCAAPSSLGASTLHSSAALLSGIFFSTRQHNHAACELPVPSTPVLGYSA